MSGDLVLTPLPVRRLTGAERFTGTDATVGGLWQWAFSDLRSNTLRGTLAEYLVAVALGAAGGTRVEWDGHDVTTASGVRIEVKSSGYLQSWRQRALSRISFSRLTAQTWSPEDSFATDRTHNADVYVFAIQTCQDHGSYDPLDLAQWEFHVVPVAKLAAHPARSFGYATLRRLSDGPVTWHDLPDAVERAASTTSA